MQYIRGMESYHDPAHTAITLGKFDGLHRGHLKLVERVQSYAKEGLKSIVFSFDMLPFFKEKGWNKKNLMTSEEKSLFLESKVDYLVECPFVEAVYTMEAEDFIKDILIGKFHAKHVVVGTDFRFGHQKKGDIHMLKAYENVYGYHLDVIEKEMYGTREISSTFIKEEMQKGNIELVETLLGRPYFIAGSVKHGRALGRKLGFPTMNITPAGEKMLPPNGVYICNVFSEGNVYAGIGNVGCRPTVSDENVTTIEAFLFDYEGQAYGQQIEVRLRKFVREEQKFSSIEELKQRVNQDIAMGKQYFENVR